MWPCDDATNRLSGVHQWMMDEKEQHIVSMNRTLWVLLEEKDARVEELRTLQESLLRKLQASESRVFQEWAFFKLSVVVLLIVLLGLVAAFIRVWSRRDQHTHRLETQMARYEGILNEKERRIQHLLETTTKAIERPPQTAASCVPHPPAHHVVYAFPGLPPAAAK